MGIGKLVEIKGFVDCVHDNDFACMGTGGVFSFVEFSIQIWKFGCHVLFSWQDSCMVICSSRDLRILLGFFFFKVGNEGNNLLFSHFPHFRVAQTESPLQIWPLDDSWSFLCNHHPC